MTFVQKQISRFSAVSDVVFGFFENGFCVGDSVQNRVELNERASRRIRDYSGESGFSRPRRAPENTASDRIHLYRAGKQRVRRYNVSLSDKPSESPRSHSVRKRRDILLSERKFLLSDNFCHLSRLTFFSLLINYDTINAKPCQ